MSPQAIPCAIPALGNESPSEKEGKCHGVRGFNLIRPGASMKALPKRKGNLDDGDSAGCGVLASMKALPKRKGN